MKLYYLLAIFYFLDSYSSDHRNLLPRKRGANPENQKYQNNKKSNFYTDLRGKRKKNDHGSPFIEENKNNDENHSTFKTKRTSRPKHPYFPKTKESFNYLHGKSATKALKDPKSNLYHEYEQENIK